MDSYIDYVRTGPRDGVPVVLLHPVGLDLTYWSAQIQALADDYDVVALDFPGHGASEGTPDDWTLPHVSEIVAGFIRSIVGSPVHLIGLSVGGMVAQSLTVAQPGLVHSLTLIDTAASFSDESRSVMRARSSAAREDGMAAVISSTIDRWFTSETATRRPDLIDRVSKTLLADDPLVHAAMWKMIAELDIDAGLEHILCPALVLVGEHDASSPISAAQQLRDGIEGACLAVIPNTAHLSPLERPDVVNAHLLQFLSATY